MLVNGGGQGSNAPGLQLQGLGVWHVVCSVRWACWCADWPQLPTDRDTAGQRRWAGHDALAEGAMGLGIHGCALVD
jgi:hypothetical protein